MWRRQVGVGYYSSVHQPNAHSALVSRKDKPPLQPAYPAKIEGVLYLSWREPVLNCSEEFRIRQELHLVQQEVD